MIDPVKFVREAAVAVPAVKYAIGVGGIAAVVAIVLSGFGIDARTAVFGVLIVLVLMVALVVFSALAQTTQVLRLPALVLCWAFLSITIASSGLLTSSFFFDYPKRIDCLFGGAPCITPPSAPKTVETPEREQIMTLSTQIAAEGPDVERLRAVESLRAYAHNVSARADKDLAVTELKKHLLNEKMSRAARRKLMEAIRTIRDRDLSRDFQGGELEKIDLVTADLSQANLAGVSFRDAFLIETDFRGATLERSVFAGANIRNVRLSGANLSGVDLTDADWFNAVGVQEEQLKAVRRETLLQCPRDSAGTYSERGFRKYLPDKYGYPFENWAPEIQEELRGTWSEYGKRGGLCELVSRWKS